MPAIPHSTKLPRASILRKRLEFENVRKHGRRRNANRMALNYLVRQDGDQFAAFIVPKACGNAVMRNRIKRRFREIYRHLRPALPAGLISIWIARRSAAGIDFTGFRDEMVYLYKKESLLTADFTLN